MGPWDWLKELGVGAVVNDVLRERLLLAKERFELIDKENVTLKEKLAEAEKRCAELQGKLEAQSAAEEFVSYRGVLFKKSPAGIDRDPYCPVCTRVMSPPLHPMFGFRCSQCQQSTPFKGSEFEGVLQELAKLGK